MMSKKSTATLMIGLFLGLGGGYPVYASEYDPATQTQIIGRLMDRFRAMSAAELASMPTLPVSKFTLPTAGVDVLRVVVEETYAIDGVGTDTVALTGWIAVKHGAPRAAPGSDRVRWGGAQMDTQFVGLELAGRSPLFGEIKVQLNPNRPSLGVVGSWPVDQVPEQAKLLQHMYDIAETERAAGGTPPVQLVQAGPKVQGFGGIDLELRQNGDKRELVPLLPEDRLGPSVPRGGPTPSTPLIRSGQCSLSLGYAARGACCAANLNINLMLPDLGLKMMTEEPVYMHSYVETIPPVGYTATVSLTPAKLIMDDRPVGILTHAAVTFREIVHHETLDPDVDATKRLRELTSENR